MRKNLGAFLFGIKLNKMEYNYDEESVNALINRAETAQLPQEVTLSEAEHIFDTSLYVNANICDIKRIIRTLSIIRQSTGCIG